MFLMFFFGAIKNQNVKFQNNDLKITTILTVPKHNLRKIIYSKK